MSSRSFIHRLASLLAPPKQAAALTLLVCATAGTAQASGVEDVLVQPPSIAAPERGSLAGTYGATQFKASDLSRGAFSLPGPFVAPTDRGPLLAKVFPGYSPDRGQSEWGLGWGADLSITRSALTGPLRYDGDEFTSPWGRLVKGDDGFFYPTGLGSLVRLTLSGDQWQAVQADGTRLYFEQKVSGTSGTYAWHLTRAVDVLGETTVLSYELNASGRPFLKTVAYGNRAQGDYRITLNYQVVTLPFADYHPGRALMLDRRVERVTIEVKHPSTRAYVPRFRYDLSYAESPNGPGFFLKSVTRVFASGQAEPPIVYEYDMGDGQLGARPATTVASLDPLVSATGSWAFKPSYVTVTDIERDGVSELEYRGLFTLARQSGAGWVFESLPPATGAEHPRCRPPVQQSRQPRNLAHLRGGDAEPLVFASRNVPGQNGSEIAVCDRAGSALYEVGMAGRWELGPNTRLADLDRDDRPDVVRVYQGGYQVLHNDSTAASIAFSAQPERGLDLLFSPDASWIHDLNGDGLPDIVAAHPAGLTVFYGLGDGTFSQQRAQLPFTTKGGLPFTNLGQREILFTDLNKDGLADVVLQSGRNLSVYVNRSVGFQEIAAPALSTLPLGASSPIFADLTGSGETQALYVYKGHAQAVTLAAAGTGLMRSVDDGKGSKLGFVYGRGPTGRGIDQRAVVLKELTTDVAGQGSVSYFYDFAQPVVHSRGRFLIGFGSVQSEAPQTLERTQFLHDDDVSGLTLETSLSDPRSSVERFSQLTYDPQNFRGLRFQRLSREVTGLRDGAGTTPVTEEVAYTNYERDVCPTRTETLTPHGTRIMELVLDNPRGLADALHCTVAEERQSGLHTDRSLDFAHAYAVTRNAAGQPLSIRLLGPGKDVVLQSVSYDAFGRAVRISDPEQGERVFGYDTHPARPSSMTRADGTVVSSQFDPLHGQIVSLREQRGTSEFVQEYRYDGLERLAKRWDNQGVSSEQRPLMEISYSYAGAGRPASYREVQLLDPSTKRQHVGFQSAAGTEMGSVTLTANGWVFRGLTELLPADSAQQIVYRTPLLGSVTPELSQLGELFAGSELLKREETSALKGLGLSRELQAANTFRTLDTAWSLRGGRLVQTTRENGALFGAVELDTAGRVMARIDAAEQRTDYTFDAAGRLRVVRLPGGDVQRASFDVYGRLSRVDRSNVGAIELRYDDGNHVREKVYSDRKGVQRTLRMQRDAVGRIVAEEHLLPNGESMLYEFTFDDGTSGQRGRLTQVRGPDFTRSTKYRGDGREIESTTTFPGFRSVTTRQDYYEDGAPRTIERIVRDGAGRELAHYTRTLEVDGFGRDRMVRLDGQPLFKYGYDAEGRLDTVEMPSGELLLLHYDPATHGRRGHTQQGVGWLLSADRVMNGRGLVAQETFDFDAPAGTVALDRSYAYDARGFLTGVASARGNESYAYDARGRLTRMQDVLGDRAIGAGQATLDAGAAHYEVDEGMRVVRQGELDLVYGANGQIAVANDGDRFLEFGYDEKGLRVLKRVNGAEEEGYVNGGVVTGDAFVEPVSIEGHFVGVLVNGRFQSIPTDERGSVLADHDGTLRPFSSYGARASHSRLAHVIEYAAKGYDADLGTVRMGVRDYDPRIGQFWTPDSSFMENMEECGENSLECNLFSYARNNPLTHTDPTGNKGVVKVSPTGVDYYDRITVNGETGILHIHVEAADLGLSSLKSATKGMQYIDGTLTWYPDRASGGYGRKPMPIPVMVTVTALSENGWREIGGKRRSAPYGGTATTTIFTGGIGDKLLNMGIAFTRISGQKADTRRSYVTEGSMDIYFYGRNGSGPQYFASLGREPGQAVPVVIQRIEDFRQPVDSTWYTSAAVGITQSGADPESADTWLFYDPNGNPAAVKP